MWVNVRSRKRAISVSSPWQILDTVDFETPQSTPSAVTRSSTLRVDTPCTSASMITAYNA